MAIFTILTKSDMKGLLDRFSGLPDASWTSRGIALGTVNTFYRIRYRTGQTYYLKIDEVGLESRLRHEIRIFENLERYQKHLSFAVPYPLSTPDGRKYSPYQNKFALIFPEVAGQSLYGADLTPGRLRLIGEKLAEWHRIPADPKVPEHRFNLAGQKKVFREIESQLSLRHPHLADFIRDKLSELSRQQPKNDRLTLIHADLFPENLLWVGRRLNGILDLDAAGRGSPLFDLGVCCHALCHDKKSFRLAGVRALLQGYFGAKGVPKSFRRDFPYALDISALRFLLTRLRDFELKDKGRKVKPFKDYREFERRFAENRALALDL